MADDYWCPCVVGICLSEDDPELAGLSAVQRRIVLRKRERAKKKAELAAARAGNSSEPTADDDLR